MPVVAAFEFQDLIAARIASCDAQCAHRRFCARRYHADHFDRWHPFLDEFRHVVLKDGRCAERCAACRLFLDGFHHFRMGVAQNQRAPGQDIIDIRITVNVRDGRAVSGLHENRVHIDRFECAHRAVDAAWHQCFRFFECLFRVFVSHIISPPASVPRLLRGTTSECPLLHVSC